MTRSLLTIMCVASFLLLESGCARKDYQGKRRPADQVAVLQASRDQSEGTIRIEAVDGREVNVTLDRLEVLPGEHELRLRIWLAPYPGEVTLLGRDVGTRYVFLPIQFIAEAGRRYEVRCRVFRSERVRVQIVDLETGEPVAEARTDWEPGPHRSTSP